MVRIAIVAAWLTVVSCGMARAQDATAIQALNDRWTAAFNRGDAAAVAAMYDEDAYVLPAGADMVRGRPAIRDFMAGAMQQLGGAKLTTIDVLKLGPLALREIGTFSFTAKGANAQPMSGKYAVVWRKIGGKWLLATDIWNMNK